MIVTIDRWCDLDRMIAEHWFDWGNFELSSDVSETPFWFGCSPTGGLTDKGEVFVHDVPEPVPSYSSERWAAYELEQKMAEVGWVVAAKVRPSEFPFVLQCPDGQKKIYAKTVCELQWMRESSECPSSTTHPAYFHDNVCVAIAMAALFAKNIQAVLSTELRSRLEL